MTSSPSVFQKICIYICVIAASSLGIGSLAQGGNVNITEINELIRHDVDSRLKSFGFGLMGDSVDTNTGALVFQHTDVSIPGNSNLEVAIRRKAAGTSMQAEDNAFFGDWVLDIPRITTLTPQVDGNGNPFTWPNRCSDYTVPNYQGSFSAWEWWSGLEVNIPGVGSEKILDNPSDKVTGERAWAKGTKAHWLVECTGTASDGGEAFKIHLPNGDKYTFARLVKFTTKAYKKTVGGSTIYLPLDKSVLFPTIVEDKNGNWVQYS